MKLLLNLIFNFAFVFVKIVNIHRRGRAAFVLCSTSDQRISQISDDNNLSKDRGYYSLLKSRESFKKTKT